MRRATRQEPRADPACGRLRCTTCADGEAVQVQDEREAEARARVVEAEVREAEAEARGGGREAEASINWFKSALDREYKQGYRLGFLVGRRGVLLDMSLLGGDVIVKELA